jgi:hypothetical protein
MPCRAVPQAGSVAEQLAAEQFAAHGFFTGGSVPVSHAGNGRCKKPALIRAAAPRAEQTAHRWRVSQGRAQPRNKQCNEHGWHTSRNRTMRQCRAATAMAARMQQRSNAVAHFGRLGGSAA